MSTMRNTRKVPREPKGDFSVIYTPFANIEGILLEQAYDGRETYYLGYNPEDPDNTDKHAEFRHNDIIYKPINSDELGKTVLFPSDIIEYQSDVQLTKDIWRFLDCWHEPPDKLSRLLDVNYAQLTYIQDLIPQIPYRRYLAPWGAGKSAWLQTLGFVCYRPLILAGSDTDKSIVRKMNTWRGTALIDEADFGKSNYYSFITKILNIGYDQTAGWYERCDDNDPNKILQYRVYGPKLLATRGKYKDPALESRCLTTIGRQNTGPIPLYRMDEFRKQALELRNKLLLWRFRNYQRIKNATVLLESPNIVNEIYDGGDISSRVMQVVTPLWLIGGEEIKQNIISFARNFDTRLKMEDPDYLLRLQVKDAIKEYVNNSENIENIKNILSNSPLNEKFYTIPLSSLSRFMLKEFKGENEELTVKEVTKQSKRLKTVFETHLGFKIIVGARKKRVILVPKKWVEEEEKPETPTITDYIEGIQTDVPDVPDVPLSPDMTKRIMDYKKELIKIRDNGDECERDWFFSRGRVEFKLDNKILENLFPKWFELGKQQKRYRPKSDLEEFFIDGALGR